MNKYLGLILISLISFTTFSQPIPGLDPEIQNLHTQASEAISMKDYQKAINIYVQAIRMQPTNIILRRDLAYAYYLNGQFDAGLKVVEQVINENAADPETYQIASALEKAKGNDKKSQKYIQDGLKKYPNSGLLYHTRGSQLMGQNKFSQALKEHLTGIDVEPNFSNNYLQAAKILYSNKEYIWASIYAEIYVLLEPESYKSSEGKRILLESIRSMYANQGIEYLPDFKNTKKNTNVDFTKALENVWLQQFIVLNDNQSIDNIIMFRTRVMLDWMSRYPISDHSLFLFHDKLLALGYFEAYNYFLFGALEDSKVYSNWINTNSKVNNEFHKWLKSNKYFPLHTDPQK